jgi:hypothetical protein
MKEFGLTADIDGILSTLAEARTELHLECRFFVAILEGDFDFNFCLEESSGI